MPPERKSRVEITEYRSAEMVAAGAARRQARDYLQAADYGSPPTLRGELLAPRSIPLAVYYHTAECGAGS